MTKMTNFLPFFCNVRQSRMKTYAGVIPNVT